MYQNAYASKEIYNRIPSCSEMLIAIQDANRLLVRANAPKHIVYKTIIRNMFKSVDDIKTFEENLGSATEENNLISLIQDMKSTEQNEPDRNINQIIAETIFKEESSEFRRKAEELKELIEEYREKFAQMEEKRKQVIEAEIRKILLENGKLVSTSKVPKAIKNFQDEAAYIKRGFDIFKLSDNDWTDIAEIKFPYLHHPFLIEKLKKYASNLDIKIYENGVLINNGLKIMDDAKQKLIVIHDLDENDKPRYRFLSNYPVIPLTYLQDLKRFISIMLEVYREQNKTVKQVTEEVVGGEAKRTYSVQALVYNEKPLEYPLVTENVYSIEMSGNVEDLSIVDDALKNCYCFNEENAVTCSKEIMKAKVKVYE